MASNGASFENDVRSGSVNRQRMVHTSVENGKPISQGLGHFHLELFEPACRWGLISLSSVTLTMTRSGPQAFQSFFFI